MIIVFDLDEVLYDEKTYVISGFRAVSEFLEKDEAIPKKIIFEYLKRRLKNGRERIFNDLLDNFRIYNQKNLKKFSNQRSRKTEKKKQPHLFREEESRWWVEHGVSPFLLFLVLEEENQTVCGAWRGQVVQIKDFVELHPPYANLLHQFREHTRVRFD